MKQFHKRFYFFSLLLMLCLVTCSGHKRQTKNPAIEKIAENVSALEIENTISDLVAYRTRFPYQKQLEVADYLIHDKPAQGPTRAQAMTPSTAIRHFACFIPEPSVSRMPASRRTMARRRFQHPSPGSGEKEPSARKMANGYGAMICGISGPFVIGSFKR